MRKFIDYLGYRDEELYSEISKRQLMGMGLGVGLMGGGVRGGEEVAARNPDTGKWELVNSDDTEVVGGIRQVKSDKRVAAKNVVTGKFELVDPSETELRGGIRYIKTRVDPLTNFKADSGEDGLSSGLFRGVKFDPVPEVSKTEVRGDSAKEVFADKDLAKSFNKDEILLKKWIVPLNYIRAAQFDKEKFDRDYRNLKSPIGKIGMDTYKGEFEKPALMYIVTDKAMDREKPDANAYAHVGEYIVLRRSAFEELPTATEDGKLTFDGSKTLAHELRHITQIGAVPREETFWGRRSDAYTAYMRDPREMGVRLAALKNYMSKQTMEKFANLWHEKQDRILGQKDKWVRQMIMDTLINVFEENANGVEMFLDEDVWAKKAYDSLSAEQREKLLSHYNNDEKTVLGWIRSAVLGIRDFKNKPNDISTIIQFYHLVPEEIKKDFMEKLKQHYDTVVMGDQELRHKLAQRYYKLKGVQAR